MMLKTISIVLPESMIQEINEILMERDFASRSDFFRFLFRFWQFRTKNEGQGKRERRKKWATGVREGNADSGVGGDGEGYGVGGNDEEAIFRNADCEFGIPEEVIAYIEKKVKLRN